MSTNRDCITNLDVLTSGGSSTLCLYTTPYKSDCSTKMEKPGTKVIPSTTHLRSGTEWGNHEKGANAPRYVSSIKRNLGLWSIPHRSFFHGKIAHTRPKRILKIQPTDSIASFFIMGEVLEACRKSETRRQTTLRVATPTAMLLDPLPKIIKIFFKEGVPPSCGGEMLWRQLLERLLNLETFEFIMKIHNIYEDAEKYYIVSEKLRGIDLFEYLAQRKQICEAHAMSIIRHILLGLNFLHKRDLLHRDIKLENVVFRSACDDLNAPPGPVVLVDFDTCKMSDVSAEEYGETVKGRRRVVGTYGYLAPEVLRGREHTQQADCWAVGVILYMLLTGGAPLRTGRAKSVREAQQILLAAQEEGGIYFDHPSLLAAPLAKDFCMKLLEFMPQRRIKSAHEALHHPWLHPREQENCNQ